MKELDDDELAAEMLEYAKSRGILIFYIHWRIVCITIFAICFTVSFLVERNPEKILMLIFSLLLPFIWWFISTTQLSIYDKTLEFLKFATCKKSRWTRDEEERLEVTFFLSNTAVRHDFELIRENLRSIIRKVIPAPFYLFTNAYLASKKNDVIPISNALEVLLESQSEDNFKIKPDDIEKLKKELSESKIETVLDSLLSINHSDEFRKDIILLKQRYSEYKKSYAVGTILFNEFVVEQTKITETLLNHIDKISENKH